MPAVTTTYDTSTVTYDQSSLSYDGFPAPLSNMPAVGVFIAWQDTPYTASPGWTDVSYLARSINIRRGRQDDLQQFPSGQCSITFDNTQRLFDPFNSSGQWFAFLKPRKQVKVVANWNGVEYPLYRGFVAGWPVEYTEAGLDSTVTVDCFDLLGLMGRELSATSYCEDYTLGLNPTLFIRCAQLSTTYTEQTISGNTRRYYDLDVVRNTTAFASYQMSVLTNTTTAGATVGSVSPVNSPALGILTQALQVGANAGIIGTPSIPSATVSATAFSFSIFCAFDSDGSTLVSPVNVSATNGYNLDIYSPVNAATPGSIQMRFFTTAGASWIVTGTTRVVDSAVHHYCATVDPTTKTIRLYLDGALIGTQVYTGDLATKGFTQFGGGSIGANSKLTFQHFAVWEDRTLSATEVATIARFGINFFNESAANRAQFYINQTSLQAGQYNIDADMTSRVGEYQLGAQPILPELQRLTAGDDGEMFVDAAGVLQLVDGNYYFNAPTSNTSQFTFTDSGTGVGYDAAGVRYAIDADQVRNTVVVTGSREFQALSTSSASTLDNGEAGENIDTRLATATDCQTLADRVLSIYKNPKFQLDPFVAKGQANPSYNWPRLLGLELLERVTFKRTPSVGSAVQRDLLVQSVEHRITPGTWETVVNGSARYTNWFIVGVSLIGGDDLLLN